LVGWVARFSFKYIFFPRKNLPKPVLIRNSNQEWGYLNKRVELGVIRIRLLVKKCNRRENKKKEEESGFAL
jgi:hypothetical protein